IEEHCRTLCSCNQQIAEFAQRMRANYIPLVGSSQILVCVLIEKNVEVIEPEFSHYFFELTLAVNCPLYFALLQLRFDDALWTIHCLNNFTFGRIEIGKEFVAQIALQICDKRSPVADRQLH